LPRSVIASVGLSLLEMFCVLFGVLNSRLTVDREESGDLGNSEWGEDFGRS
jgi:hypothetical protein